MAHATGTACGARVLIEGLEKRFGQRCVLRQINLVVEPGAFVAIVGASGCGKSTLLRVLSGLEEPSAGTARVVDSDGSDARSSLRVVFQEPRLLPWRRVLDNVCLGMAKEHRGHARSVLASVGLGDRGSEFPALLSGGQRQRVGLARALVHDPRVLLLDEPFGALDALTRIEAQRLVEELWLARGFTAMLVTHDVTEAVLLAERVLLIQDGRIAKSFDVNVPRPRRRGDPDVARIAGNVLDAIFRNGSGDRELSPARACVGEPPRAGLKLLA
ncbi:MAG: ABC transporter ATP-binding protein [Myxococcota bacterium]